MIGKKFILKGDPERIVRTVTGTDEFAGRIYMVQGQYENGDWIIVGNFMLNECKFLFKPDKTFNDKEYEEMLI